MGYIYLLQLVNCYKLGRTDDFGKRLAQYKISEPKVILCIECEECVKVEQELLKRFREKFKKREDLGKEHFDLNSDKNKMIFEITNYFSNNSKSINKETSKIANNIVIKIKQTNGKEIKKDILNSADSNLKLLNVNDNLICERCGVDFKEKKHLIQHLNKKEECMPLFSETNRNDLILLLTEKNGIQCEKCKKNYSSKYYLEKHKCKKEDNEIIKKAKKEIKYELKKEIMNELKL